MAPFLDKNFGDWFSNPEEITWTKNWKDTLDLLQADFGAGTDVGIIPNATMQYHNFF